MRLQSGHAIGNKCDNGRDWSRLPGRRLHVNHLSEIVHGVQGMRTLHGNKCRTSQDLRGSLLTFNRSTGSQMAPMATALVTDGAVARINRGTCARQPFRSQRPCHRQAPGRRQELVIRAAEADRSRFAVDFVPRTP